MVPEVRPGMILSVPPANRALSRIPIIPIFPEPKISSSVMPFPLSSTLIRKMASSFSTETNTSVACECRAAFVKAS